MTFSLLNRRFSAALLISGAAYATLCPLSANVDLPKDRRTALDTFAELLDRSVLIQPEDYSSLRYPFDLPPKPVVVQAPVETPKETEQPIAVVEAPPPPPVVTKSNEQILKQVADTLSIAGVLKDPKGNSLLRLKNGRNLSSGPLNVKLPSGESYSLVVESISNDAYVLRLDDTRHSVSLKKDYGGVQRTQK